MTYKVASAHTIGKWPRLLTNEACAQDALVLPSRKLGAQWKSRTMGKRRCSPHAIRLALTPHFVLCMLMHTPNIPSASYEASEGRLKLSGCTPSPFKVIRINLHVIIVAENICRLEIWDRHPPVDQGRVVVSTQTDWHCVAQFNIRLSAYASQVWERYHWLSLDCIGQALQVHHHSTECKSLLSRAPDLMCITRDFYQKRSNVSVSKCDLLPLILTYLRTISIRSLLLVIRIVNLLWTKLQHEVLVFTQSRASLT
jgi:hypothetical protein